ncbi:MAG: pseudouridine synthase, partial [Pseudomonadota bacterium]
VETPPDAAGLATLVDGVRLNDGPARALAAQRIDAPPVPPRDPPPQPRVGRATGWLEIALSEGRNRQIRRMCAAVDAPVLRLIRCAIGGLDLKWSDLAPGSWRRLNREDIAACLLNTT